MRLISFLALTSLVLTACGEPGEGAQQAEEAGHPKVEYLMANPESGRPFSDAVRVGGLLILSGQIGVDSVGQVVAGGIGPETRQTMENIKAVLERNGAAMDDIIKCTAMLLDMAEWGAMNEVYRSYFTTHLPARSAFGTSGLALGARIELECWAAVPERD